MHSPTELSSRFRQRGLKVTPQRVCIFEILHDSGVHPTAEAVFEEATLRMPTIALKTVYQTLNDLAKMGEIQQLDLGTGSSRFDPNIEDHHHLVCTECGTVRDFYAELSPVDVVPSAIEDFFVQSTEIVYRGLCGSCLAGQATSQSISYPSPTPHKEED